MGRRFVKVLPKDKTILRQNIEFDIGNELEIVNNAYIRDPKAFKELLEQVEKPLYPRYTKFTRLGFFNEIIQCEM